MINFILMYKEEEKKYKDDEREGEISRDIFGDEVLDDELAPDEEKVLPSIGDAIDVPKISGSEKEVEKNMAESAISQVVKPKISGDITSPKSSGGDVDAEWDLENVSGSETAYSNDEETPDQDQVDALSEPWGTDYNDDEEINTEKKLRKLNSNRNDDEIGGFENNREKK